MDGSQHFTTDFSNKWGFNGWHIKKFHIGYFYWFLPFLPFLFSLVIFKHAFQTRTRRRYCNHQACSTWSWPFAPWSCSPYFCTCFFSKHAVGTFQHDLKKLEVTSCSELTRPGQRERERERKKESKIVKCGSSTICQSNIKITIWRRQNMEKNIHKWWAMFSPLKQPRPRTFSSPFRQMTWTTEIPAIGAPLGEHKFSNLSLCWWHVFFLALSKMCQFRQVCMPLPLDFGIDGGLDVSTLFTSRGIRCFNVGIFRWFSMHLMVLRPGFQDSAQAIHIIKPLGSHFFVTKGSCRFFSVKKKKRDQHILTFGFRNLWSICHSYYLLFVVCDVFQLCWCLTFNNPQWHPNDIAENRGALESQCGQLHVGLGKLFGAPWVQVRGPKSTAERWWFSIESGWDVSKIQTYDEILYEILIQLGSYSGKAGCGFDFKNTLWTLMESTWALRQPGAKGLVENVWNNSPQKAPLIWLKCWCPKFVCHPQPRNIIGERLQSKNQQSLRVLHSCAMPLNTFRLLLHLHLCLYRIWL